MKLRLLPGNAHPDLAREISEILSTPLCDAEVSRFADGETKVKIDENIRGHDVFLLQPTCPPTNHNLMELLIMADAVRRASAGRMTAVVPFYGYARQDRKEQSRVPITAKLVANLMTASGIERVLTMDLHAGQIQGFFDIPVDHLYAAPVLLDYMRERGTKNLVVVSPDVGGIKMTHAYSQALNTDMAIVAKERLSDTEVVAHSIIGKVRDRDVLLVDDLTETAGTLCAAAELLRKNGARTIRAAVSHAVLGDKGRQRLVDSEIEELICTNSTPMANGDKVTCLSIGKLLAEAIARIHEGKSVSSLFST
ncbi:MAG: ribose-phosphate pyrophosphokinase [Verrucomicrobiota bacterium]